MGRKLYIFDFDDTLVSSNAMIKILDPQGTEVRALTSEEYAISDHKKQITSEEKSLGFVEDFSDFDTYPPDGETLPSFNKFMTALSEAPGDVHVLSARSAIKPMIEFLSDSGASGFQTMGVGGSNPSLKSNYVLSLLNDADPAYTDVEVFEDSQANITAIESAVKSKYPDINFSSILVTTHKESLLRKFVRAMLLKEYARG
jgi:beta-phosphoglucomutase-like phosphatase (HAD superfamily)